MTRYVVLFGSNRLIKYKFNAQTDKLTRVALSIAGSDSGAGAGIQADLKTFSALGVYGCTAITAITAQNTQKVSSIFEIETEIIRKQINSIMADIPPDAIKIGMVYSKEVIHAVTKFLLDSKSPVVLDPVLASRERSKAFA